MTLCYQNSKNNNTQSNKFKLTNEQVQAVNYFKSKETLKVNAFAGAGKTSTLVEMAKSSKHSGLYLAFNKKIATDASKVVVTSDQCDAPKTRDALSRSCPSVAT